MKAVKFSKYVHLKFETPESDYSEWFGYYNYDALNDSCTKMLCNRATFDGVAPQKGMEITIGYYDLLNGEYHDIATTDSWNWQQGAMAQWLPTEDGSEKVVFNVSKNNHLVAKIVDIHTKAECDIDWSIYGISPTGDKSIALEMERSRWCRAYHYKSVDNLEQEGLIIPTDGIFQIDLHTNARKRIVDIHDVLKIDADDNFSKKKHWLEHIMISPNGKHFCFLHRFSDINNVYNYSTRLCIADIDGSNLQVVPGWRTMTWTHFGWKTDDEFVIYTYTPNKVKSNYGFREALSNWKDWKGLIKGFYCTVTSRLPYPVNYILNGGRQFYQYYKINDDGKWGRQADWQKSYFTIDGHPSFTSDGRYMITDSYPDKNGYQHLIIFDTITLMGLVVAEMFAFYKGNPASCDLHPKLCKNDRYVVLDSAYDSKHHMIMLELKWDAIKKKISK